jgi:hypothetical protein
VISMIKMRPMIVPVNMTSQSATPMSSLVSFPYAVFRTLGKHNSADSESDSSSCGSAY